jgi:hypothetical protein
VEHSLAISPRVALASAAVSDFFFKGRGDCGVPSVALAPAAVSSQAALASDGRHCRLALEPSLVENEIGGVILGSLRAAQAGRALTRAEYLSDKRSNVDNKTDQVCQLRERVYDEYQLVAKWKRGQGGLFDIKWQHNLQKTWYDYCVT